MALTVKSTLMFWTLGLALAGCAQAQTSVHPNDPNWLALLEQQAIDNGVNPSTVHKALDGFIPDARVLELDQKQPEGTQSFDTYRRNSVTAMRIKKGAEYMKFYAPFLSQLEQSTGVPPQIVVALWGIESNFGQNSGHYATVDALTTLVYGGRRADYFRSELFAALHILDNEHLTSQQLIGSWAGAMGQCQFMPSTYLKYSVDGDGDGRRDIWSNPYDVMASIANYLAAEGWHGALSWGRAVEARDVDISEVGLGIQHTMQEWAEARVRGADGSVLPRAHIMASLVEPDGENGAQFLVTDNIRAVMRWNHSTYFALSVGLLADQIQQMCDKYQ